MYAENAAGPWNTVAAGLPNSGQYYWPMAGIVPKRALLRIEVRDDAGNLGSYQLNEPINLQGLNPAGRIRGFSPAAPPPTAGDASGSQNGSYNSSPSGGSSRSPSGTEPGGASGYPSPGYSSSDSPPSGSNDNSGAARIPLFGTRRR
jgi:hypothetical protein